MFRPKLNNGIGISTRTEYGQGKNSNKSVLKTIMVRGRIEINRTLFALNDEAVLQHYQRNFPLHIAKLYFYGFRSVYGHTDQKNCESN